MGYRLAGFEMVGVDISDQPRYPYAFEQADAHEYLVEHGHEFDAIHASPPCQAHSLAWRIQKNDHPDLIGQTRDLLEWIGKPYVIENVEGAPLRNTVTLCGAMFGLRTYRHRLFETGGGFTFEAPEHPVHVAKNTKMGRKLQPGEFMHVVGNFTGVADGREIMGMPWANRDGLREAIPPAYTQHIGEQLIREVLDARQENLRAS